LAESIINWVEHDGSDIEIKGDFIVWQSISGSKGHTFDYLFIGEGVARYAIVPLPEFLS